MLGGINLAANPISSSLRVSGMGWDGIVGRVVSPCASPTGCPDLLWAALGHRSVTGEPADQHEVQVHQIHRPRHQPGADPHHRCYPAWPSLQEEGGHVSGTPGNQSLCALVQKYMGEGHKCWGDSCFPIPRGSLPAWLWVLRSWRQNSTSLWPRVCIHAQAAEGFSLWVRKALRQGRTWH